MNGVYFQDEQRSDMKNKRNAMMSKGEIMNRLATSKEDILAASRELINQGKRMGGCKHKISCSEMFRFSRYDL